MNSSTCIHTHILIVQLKSIINSLNYKGLVEVAAQGIESQHRAAVASRQASRQSYMNNEDNEASGTLYRLNPLAVPNIVSVLLAAAVPLKKELTLVNGLVRGSGVSCGYFSCGTCFNVYTESDLWASLPDLLLDPASPPPCPGCQGEGGSSSLEYKDARVEKKLLEDKLRQLRFVLHFLWYLLICSQPPCSWSHLNLSGGRAPPSLEAD